MMELLFLNILLAGAGILILLFIRALPRVEEAVPERRGVFERWLTSKLPEKIDAAVRSVFLRILRRLKVLVLRLDNGINQKLQRMRLQGGPGMNGEKDKIDLRKISESNLRDGNGDKGQDRF